MLIGSDGKPKITHGYTWVSELSFVEVVETINVSISSMFGSVGYIFNSQKYAFNASQFPLILSLENHCSAKQQVCDFMGI